MPLAIPTELTFFLKGLQFSCKNFPEEKQVREWCTSRNLTPIRWAAEFNSWMIEILDGRDMMYNNIQVQLEPGVVGIYDRYKGPVNHL